MDQNRFKSFTVPRPGNDVKWYIDGHDYFWALSEALEDARETIWICDWWLSPELYLRRPPAQNEHWRLDRILKRKAEQGVKIFIQVYKEVNVSMTLNSKYTSAFDAGHARVIPAEWHVRTCTGRSTSQHCCHSTP